MIDVISMLCQKFLAAFFQFEERRKPLARGIHREIALPMPTLTKVQISGAMHYYTNSEGYCRACRAGAMRINLMGHEVGCVTAAEADNAVARIEAIKEWRKKQKAARKAAARAAEIEAKKPKPTGVNASRPTLHLNGIGGPSRATVNREV
jgi:sRNA-binding protein